MADRPVRVGWGQDRQRVFQELLERDCALLEARRQVAQDFLAFLAGEAGGTGDARLTLEELPTGDTLLAEQIQEALRGLNVEQQVALALEGEERAALWHAITRGLRTLVADRAALQVKAEPGNDSQDGRESL